MSGSRFICVAWLKLPQKFELGDPRRQTLNTASVQPVGRGRQEFPVLGRSEWRAAPAVPLPPRAAIDEILNRRHDAASGRAVRAAKSTVVEIYTINYLLFLENGDED